MARPLILTGASGWFGRTALWEYEQLYGAEALRSNVLPCASSAKLIDFGSPHGPIQAVSLAHLDQVSSASGLIHLAFLTREQVASVGLDRYVSSNRLITETIACLIANNPGMPIITTSSGAAAALDGQPLDLAGDPYGSLKQEEENLWRRRADSRMAIVFRVYAAAGRFLKDPSLFALGNFIQQAQAGKAISIRSPRPVIRSYVHVGTLMRLCWLMLKQPLPSGYRQIDAVTHSVTLLELAQLISTLWSLPPAVSSIDPSLPPDHYAADPAQFVELLSTYELIAPSLIDQIRETAASLPES
jgi:nucleoside-diphosphate-sugar epimerase